MSRWKCNCGTLMAMLIDTLKGLLINSLYVSCNTKGTILLPRPNQKLTKTLWWVSSDNNLYKVKL